MFEVVYYSCTGNSRKVAEVIGDALGVTPQEVGSAVVSPDAFVFLGLDCFRDELPDVVRAFIHQNRFRGRRIALFTASVFGTDVEHKAIVKQLEAEGAVIVRNFKCLGEFLDFNKDHPSWWELKKAAWFARSAALTLFDKREERVEALSLVA